MKRIISILLLVSIFVFMSACSAEPAKPDTKNITSSDRKYINTVYKYIDAWDVEVSDSGRKWNIDKVAFYDFDGSGQICFYVHYPIIDVYGWGFNVSNDGTIEAIDPDFYDHDTKRINSGWILRTGVLGTDWDSSASKKQKKAILKKAYKYFLNNNIYDN